MNSKVLTFINKLEGYKTAIKQLHWDAKNLSQHELCDDIAESIAEFQDTVSEVEQSITGKLKVNSLKPTEYKIKDLKTFVEDVLDATNSFYKEVKDMGDTYVGMASDCESFLSDMQRKLYLVNFTLKEELKERLRGKINESMPKNLAKHDEVDKFIGRRPKTMKARINQIYRIVKKYGIDSKVYHDENWQAISDYYRAITSLGCEVEMKPCGHLENADSMQSDGGYCDYAEDGMPRSKQYAIKIMFEDGMSIDGYIKCMAAGRVDDPFSAYDTCIVLWPKSNRVLENREINESISAHDIFREVKDEIFNLRNKGEIDLPIIGGGLLDGLTKEEHIVAYFRSEDKITVEYGGEKREIPCDINSQNDDYIARCIMCGFAQIVKGIREGKEMKNQIKLTEAELKQVVKEAAMKILSETPLNYDVDNFSGRWNKPSNGYDLTSGEEYIDDEGYLDDPYKHDEIENALADDEWEWGKDMDMKGAENEYSWDRFEHKPIAPGLDPYYSVGKRVVPREVDNAIAMRNKQGDWRDNELRHGRRMMDKWVNGQRDNEDLEDSWDDLKYMNRFEGKEPMKVTEEELKTIVKEAAMQIIREHGENVSRYIKRGGFGGRRKTGDPRKDRELEQQWFEKQKEKQRKQLEKVSKGTDESIEIKPENKGKFTATKKATGKSTEELTHSKNPLTRKRAIFAQNAKKWNHKK